MTYKEFLELLEELQLDLDSASEALDLEISDIEAWEEEEKFQNQLKNGLKKKKLSLQTLNNTNEDRLTTKKMKNLDVR